MNLSKVVWGFWIVSDSSLTVLLKRWLILINENNCIYRKQYRVQTALWFNDETYE
jgi:hypothetical protein